MAAADFVVDNSGSPEHLDEEVERLWAWMATLEHVDPPTARPPEDAQPDVGRLIRRPAAPAGGPRPSLSHPLGTIGDDARVPCALRVRTGRRPAEGHRRAGRRGEAGRPLPDAPRHHRVRQVGHHRLDRRAGAEAHAGPGAQQVAGRAAGQRVPGVLPRQPGRVLRLVLRLLPARGVPPQLRHLHREGRHDQRRDRPAPPLGHLGAAHPPRHDRRRLGVRHLRPRLARGVPEELPDPAGRRGARPAGHPRPAGRHAVRAQRHEPRPGQVPGPGRHDRGAPRLRRDDRAHRDVRRHDRVDHGGRPGHRRAADTP